jgi:hypothetical protein
VEKLRELQAEVKKKSGNELGFFSLLGGVAFLRVFALRALLMRQELLSARTATTCFALLCRWGDVCRTDWGAAAFLAHLVPEVADHPHFHTESPMSGRYDAAANSRVVSFLYVALASGGAGRELVGIMDSWGVDTSHISCLSFHGCELRKYSDGTPTELYPHGPARLAAIKKKYGAQLTVHERTTVR